MNMINVLILHFSLLVKQINNPLHPVFVSTAKPPAANQHYH